MLLSDNSMFFSRHIDGLSGVLINAEKRVITLTFDNDYTQHEIDVTFKAVRNYCDTTRALERVRDCAPEHGETDR